MKKITLLIVFLFGTMLHAQVGINTTSPDASSMLDISATNKGVLVPRVSLTNVTLTTLDGTNTAATGLLIWNTNATTTGGSGVGFYFYNGTQWMPITQSATPITLDQAYDQGGAGAGKLSHHRGCGAHVRDAHPRTRAVEGRLPSHDRLGPHR